MEPRRCVAPKDGDDEQLCGELATTERDVLGIVCHLCAAHAAEIDSETNPTTNQGNPSC